ncbi:MAG: methylated-DNA--[protein]-cysteine S-methyltransferase [Halobacteriales archaeon]
MGATSGIEHRWSEYLETYVQVGVVSGSVVSVRFVNEPGEESDERAEGQGSDALRAVFAYLNGEVETTPDVPYALTVSGVERKALERTRDVPYGTTTTYAEFAARVGEGDDEGVARVRDALHDNPVPIVLPSHRVVAEDSVGGFAGPRRVKERLLALEE